MHKILLVDSDVDRLNALQTHLEFSQCYEINTANSFKKALAYLKSDNYAIILYEHSTSTTSIQTVIEEFSPSNVIISDAQPSTGKAIQAIKCGAYHYLSANEFTAVLACIDEVAQLEERKQHTIEGMIGECAAMQQMHHYIRKTAPTDCNVLILGETGTGKELVAKAIHSNSNRKNNTLISVNCAAIPETLIESELFGYEKGAFTGADTSRQGLIEAAHKGTLFLDEIGELPLEAQARLLRFIQEGEIRRIGSVTSRQVDVRLIAATHRDLKKLCANNQFREDLFYRINVMQLNLPPLRERGADILEIAYKLLELCCEKYAYPRKQFSERAIALITDYSWPGNIRELENIIERAVIISDPDQPMINDDLLFIEPVKKSLLTVISSSSAPAMAESFETDKLRHTAVAKDIEAGRNLSLEDYFLSFVLKHQDSMSETELARKLGVSRKCLWERRQRLGIPRRKSARNIN